MLEVRYDKNTKEVTGWCADEKQFGNLKKRWETEEIVTLNIPTPEKPMPEKSCEAYLFDEATETLINNPDYIEPEPVRDLAAEIDEIKVRVEKLEKK